MCGPLTALVVFLSQLVSELFYSGGETSKMCEPFTDGGLASSELDVSKLLYFGRTQKPMVGRTQKPMV